MKPSDEPTHGKPGPELSHEQRQLEAQLSALHPRSDRLNRDRLIFLAGQASVSSLEDAVVLPSPSRWQRRTGPTAFAVMSTVAAVLLAMLIVRSPGSVGNPTLSLTVRAPVTPRLSYDMVVPNDDRISVRDGWRPDLEEHLARRRSIADVPTPRNEDHSTPLTPASWRQLLKDSPTSAGLPTDTTSTSITVQGINV